MSQPNPDRYVSFHGIDCDGKAHRLMAQIQQYVDCPPHSSPWVQYFRQKLSDRQALGQDDLYFVGSQINNIRALLEEYGDTAALAVLEQLEEDCC